MSFRTIFAIIVEAGLLIMVMGTEIKEFLIAAACIGGLLVVSFFSVLWALLAVRFSTISNENSCEREQEVRFTLKANGILIFPVVCKITIRTPFKERRKSKFPINNKFALEVFKLNRSLEFNINCPHSGTWQIGIRSLVISDIFGFFNIPVLFILKKQCTAEITVVPKFYQQVEFAESAGSIDNLSSLSFGNSELGDTFDDNRDYRYGDPLRRINWKQSAKFGNLVTRTYERPRKSRAVVALDYYTLESRGGCDDCYREAALFISEYFAEQKNDVTIRLLRPENLKIEFDCNDVTDLSNLAVELAGISFKKDTSPLTDTLLKDFDFEDRDKVFIISSNPHHSVIASAEAMNNQGMQVAIITPKTDAINQDLDSTYITVLNGSDEITKKVGAVLC